MNRITNAGGFVNQFGRVNGNLNLSRSIGDLKYKQVPGIDPAEQKITAEPDILRYVFGVHTSPFWRTRSPFLTPNPLPLPPLLVDTARP